MLGMASLSLTSCGDIADEITSIIYDRNFSPTDFVAGSIKEESAVLKWNPSQGATSYTIEVFQDDSLTFNGSPVQTIDNITATTYTLSNLMYDTKYSVRIKALTEGEETKTSKWNGCFFQTEAQQIFEDATQDDVKDTYVTLRWPAGEAVTTLQATSASGEVVTKALNADEIAAGTATLTGLKPETKYTVLLLNGEKQRGSKTFTTTIDLNGVTAFVKKGDDLTAVLNAAQAGDVIAVYGGTYDLNVDDEGKPGKVEIHNGISVKGVYPTDQPVIRGRFEIYGGATLAMTNVTFDGSANGGNGDQAFNYKDAVSYGGLNLQNCNIKGFLKGFMYVNVAAQIKDVTINNCVISDIKCDGGDMFDCRKGVINNFTMTNTTVYNSCAERDFIRFDDSSSAFAGQSSKVTVDHCTIDGVGKGKLNKGFLYVRFADNSITWTNNIISNTQQQYSNQKNTSLPTYANNVYYNAQSLTTVASDQTKSGLNFYVAADGTGAKNFSDGGGTTADPQYNNASAGDFTVGNATVKGMKVGDPRWVE